MLNDQNLKDETDFTTKTLNMTEVNNEYLEKQSTKDLQQLAEHLLKIFVRDIEDIKENKTEV